MVSWVKTLVLTLCDSAIWETFMTKCTMSSAQLAENNSTHTLYVTETVSGRAIFGDIIRELLLNLPSKTL